MARTNGQLSIFDEALPDVRSVLNADLLQESFSHGRQIRSLFARATATDAGLDQHKAWLLELARTVKAQGELISELQRDLTESRSEIQALKVLSVSKVRK